jgi:hypothetical protein
VLDEEGLRGLLAGAAPRGEVANTTGEST